MRLALSDLLFDYQPSSTIVLLYQKRQASYQYIRGKDILLHADLSQATEGGLLFGPTHIIDVHQTATTHERLRGEPAMRATESAN